MQRDLKAYIKKHADREIPVGYSAADVREILQDTWAYMQCDNGDNSHSDIFGLNSYSWCGGDATFDSAGYTELVKIFDNSSIPVFFSEYGCNEVMPRVFDEVEALYSDKMKSLSGGLVYEYSQEESNYGLATIQKDGSVKLHADYDNLKKQFAKLDMAKLQATSPAATGAKLPKCDKSLITNAAFETDFAIPALCPGCDALISSGVTDARKGKLVKVAETKAPNKILSTSGSEMKDLALKLVSNEGTGSSSNTTTSAKPSASSTTLVSSTSSSKASSSTIVSSSAISSAPASSAPAASSAAPAASSSSPAWLVGEPVAGSPVAGAAGAASTVGAASAQETEQLTKTGAATKLAGAWTIVGAAVAMLAVL